MGGNTVGRWPNKYVIGLTGNIATGKSVVRQMLQHLEAYTIDADSLTHRAMAPGAPAYKPVIDTFGQFILDAEKNINRALLGTIVFSNPGAMARLEAIVHPIVGGAVATLVSRAPQKVIVIEAIKLLEGDLGKAVDEVWVVDASPETQLKRLMEKRKMSEAEARQRIAAQPPQAEKISKAAVVIHNDGNVEETWKQVQAAWVNLQAKVAGMGGAAPAVPVTQPLQPAAAPPAAPVAAPAVPVDIKVHIRRGMPSHAEAIANFINASAAKTVTRMDIMMAFGQKSYLIAQDQADRMLGVMGWQVENLITRVDECYLTPSVPLAPVVDGLIAAIEAASRDLQSEVAYFFLPDTLPADLAQSFQSAGYDLTTVEQIKIPAWRESVQEILSEYKSARIFSKKLREDRVLKPI
ncbi:MAG: dephospho-CoA kinase [Anaerolineae bacterium]|nr:dephospho-CoA kinase [Anaerolineae bacterium]